MSGFIDYYYAPISGYAYLGEPRLVALAKRHQVRLNFKPVDIARVFAEAGTTPPPKQPASRVNYRMLDLQRTADYLALPIHPKPRHWPVPIDVAARAIYAAIAQGIAPHGISFAILSAVYAEQKNVADEEVIKDILAHLSDRPDAIWAEMSSPSIKQSLEQATQDAIALGVFGSPTYVLNGTDMYFGQDRLPLLEHRLTQLAEASA